MFSESVVANLSRSSVVRMMFEEGERLKKIYGAENVYDFTLGNPDVEPPIKAKEVLMELASSSEKGMHRYMSNAGYAQAREAVAKATSKEQGVEVSPNHICMTCGAAGGLNVALKSLLNPQDEVIILAPYFVEYLFYIQNFDGVPVIVETQEDFDIDISAFEKNITARTKAIIINSPNNPTGVVYSEKKLKELASLLKRKEVEYGTQIYILSDEPYVKITYDVVVPPMFKIFKNAIIVNSYSKSLALPGERIGYLVPNPAIDQLDLLVDAIQFCNRTLGFVNAPAIAQRIITATINEQVDITAYREKRDILYNGITELGFECRKPDGAFYLFVKSPIEDDSAFIKHATEKYRIIAAPGSGFGRKGYFRLAYCINKTTIVNSMPSFRGLAEEYFRGKSI